MERNHLIIFACILLLGACSPDREKPDRLAMDRETTHDSCRTSFYRFDRRLFEHGEDDLLERFPEFEARLGKFFNLYHGEILSLSGSTDSMMAFQLQDFTRNRDIREVYDSTQKIFSDLRGLESEVGQAFCRYRKSFPGKAAPVLVTLQSGFNYSQICADSVLAVSLEMYLGENCDFYKRLGIPRYKARKMSRHFLSSDMVRAWMQTEFEPATPHRTFLDKIIFEGKMQLALDSLLPHLEDSIKLGYTKPHLAFCHKNEKVLWAMFLDQNLLFNSNERDYGKFLMDGPTTNGLPKESPAKIGAWVGYRIVQSFMENNPSLTLKDLLLLSNGQEILNRSKYKP